MKVYATCSKRDYGKPAKRRLLEAVKAQWPTHEIIDPELFDWRNLAWSTGGHESAYDHVVSEVDVVAVLEHQGFVGRGVYTEITCALRQGKSAYVLRDGRWFEITELALVDNGRDWKVRYGRISETGAAAAARQGAPQKLIRSPSVRMMGLAVDEDGALI